MAPPTSKRHQTLALAPPLRVDLSRAGHLELPVDEQLARSQPWAPADEPVLDDLTDDEEAEFLAAIAR